MLFDFKLELEEAPRSITRNILFQIHKYRFYAALAIVGIILGFYVSVSLGVAFVLGSSVIHYMYKIWIDISSISFSTDGLSFDLQDVINDLEAM